MAGTLRVASVGLAALALVASTPAWSQSTCTAEPGASTSNLAFCVRTVAVGGTITLKPGTHQASNLVIDRSMTLVAEDPTDTRIVHPVNGALEPDPDLIASGGLREDLDLFFISDEGTQVVVQGVALQPALGFDQGLGIGFVRGRAFVVDGARLELRSVKLEAWREAGLGDSLTVLTGTAAEEPDINDEARIGGMLALAVNGAEVVVDGSVVRQIAAPSLYGSAIFAIDAETLVTVRGATSFEDIRSLAGAVAGVDGAQITVESDRSGNEPLFRRLQAEIGGALVVADAGLTVLAGSFHDNGRPRTRPDWSATYGGAIAGLGESEVRIAAANVSSSEATYGGAVASLGARLLIEATSFDGNRAAHGAAVWAAPFEGETPDVRVSDSEFEGGEVSLVAQERAAPERLGFPRAGALRVVGGALRVEGSTFTGNGGAGSVGGAIDLVDATAQVISSSFSANNAGNGGAVAALTSTLSLVGGKLEGNTVDGAGGGVAITGGSLVIDGVEFIGNRAGTSGAVWALTGDRVDISGASFIGNEADLAGAVGVIVGAVTVDGTWFQDNVARLHAGGHFAALSGESGSDGEEIRGTVTVEDSTFLGGSAESGGAIAIGAGSVILRDLAIDGATAATAGGGVFINETRAVTMERVGITGTSSSTAGGGVYLRAIATANLVDVSVTGASSAVGGGIALEQVEEASLIRPVLCGNRAGQGSAAALSFVGGSAVPATISNALMHGASEPSSGLLHAAGSNVTLAQSALIGGNGPAGRVDEGVLAVTRTLVGWVGQGGASSPIVAGDSGRTSFVDGAVFLPDWPAALRDDLTALGLPPRTLLGQPRLRAITVEPLDDPDRMPACDPTLLHEQLHPRPQSPTLLQGYPADEDDDLIGIFGGPARFVAPWRTDEDNDGTPWIFDCDDQDPAIGDRLVQYVDGDGDGVGGELWPGDDCHLVPANVVVDGDCDDADPTVAAVCGDLIGYYGARCQAVPGSTLPWGLLLAIPWLARRRRIG